MKLVVQDANILIDLLSGNVLDAFFRLGWSVHTTNAVLDEVKAPLGKVVKSGHLQVVHLSGDEIGAIAILLHQLPKRISFEDCSLLDLASRMQALLLTGDANLRHCAEQRHIDVRGTLWLLDQMIESNVLPKKRAAAALTLMIRAGRRLPIAERDARLTAWK